MRWNKKFDGTKDSLVNKSHKLLSKHPNSHTEEELKWIQDYHRRNPKISVCKLYGKLRANKGYSRHPGSLYRVYRRLGNSNYAPSTKKKRKPQVLQTDNGAEFTHLKKAGRTHPLDVVCNKLGITHKRIRPRTPRHNGKVERSHRNDQERFYNHMSFYNYNDLLIQMNIWFS